MSVDHGVHAEPLHRVVVERRDVPESMEHLVLDVWPVFDGLMAHLPGLTGVGPLLAPVPIVWSRSLTECIKASSPVLRALPNAPNALVPMTWAKGALTLLGWWGDGPRGWVLSLHIPSAAVERCENMIREDHGDVCVVTPWEPQSPGRSPRVGRSMTVRIAAARRLVEVEGAGVDGGVVRFDTLGWDAPQLNRLQEDVARCFDHWPTWPCTDIGLARTTMGVATPGDDPFAKRKVEVPSYLLGTQPLAGCCEAKKAADPSTEGLEPALGETAALPPSDEILRLRAEAEPTRAYSRTAATAALASRDDDATDLEAKGAPNVPKVSDAPPADPVDPFDTTAFMPSPVVPAVRPGSSFAENLTPTMVPDLSIAQYAELRAALTRRGEDDEATWREFGVHSSAARDALRATFAARFERDASAREDFVQLVREATRRLNRRG